MKKRWISFIVAASLTGALLAGCQDGAQTGGAAAEAGTAGTADTAGSTADTGTDAAGQEDNILRLGVSAPMTGGYALYGEGAQNAVDMAVEEINAGGGKFKVEIINGGKVMDDAGDSKQAVNAYNSMMAEHPDAFIATYNSSCSLPMAELAQKDGMLQLVSVATNYKITEVGDHIFRACFIDPYQGKMAARFAGEKGCKKTAVIYAKDDDYSNGLKDAFVENAPANGMEVVYTGECTSKDTDFSAQVSQVVASGADYLFFPCILDIVPLLVQQARDAGFEGIIMGGDAWDGSDTTGLESYFENTYYTNHYSAEDTSESVQTFVQKYTEKYGDDSLTAAAALYYDCVYMLVKAAEDADATDTESLVKAMTNMEFSGVTGTFTLNDTGDPEKNVVINTYVDGKVKWVMTLEPED